LATVCFKDVTRVADERLAIRGINITDETGDLAMARILEIENHPSGEIGMEIHIGFLDSDEAFDGGTIEHDLIVERIL
jgi:hypothetical protein